GGLEPGATVWTGVVRRQKPTDDELAGLDGRDGVADLLHNAAVLMTDRPGPGDFIQAAVRPQVRSADAAGHGAHDCVRGFPDRRVGTLLKAHVARPMKNRSSHVDPPVSKPLPDD